MKPFLFVLAWLSTTALGAVENRERLTVSGYIESGVSFGADQKVGSPRGSQWILDAAVLRLKQEVTPLVRLIFDNALALGSPTVSPTHGYTNSSNFFSTKAQVRVGGPTSTGAASESSQLVLSNLNAAVELAVGENATVRVGHLRVPFGLEGKFERIDLPTYYYSNSYTAAQIFGWHYDFGVTGRFELGRFASRPAFLEAGLFDGRHPRATSSTGTPVSSPAGVLRYSHVYDSGETNVTSALSLYLGRFRGRPGDVGGTLGAYSRFGRVRFHFEYLFTSTMTSYTSDLTTAQAFPGTEYVGETTTIARSLDILGQAKPGHRAQAWSIYVEPGYAFTDSTEVTAKMEYGNHEYSYAKEDINLALGLSHRLDASTLVRVVYQHFNLLGNLATHAHDARVLLNVRI